MAAASPRARIPLKVVLGLAAAILIDTLLQILWKFAALSIPPEHAGFLQTIEHALQPLFIGVGLMLVLQLVNWVAVLGNADLSYLQPITALSYVSVVAASAVWLDEPVTLQKVAGVVVILAGVWLICSTDHRTEPPPAAGE